MHWTYHLEIAARTPIFTVERVCFDESAHNPSHPFYRIRCADWVNTLGITEDNKAILVKQPRAGSMTDILETAGGAVDPDEKAKPEEAALRELEEETGYTSKSIISLGSLNPNPALQTNTVHFFLAKNCKLQLPRVRFPDKDEEIEVHKVPLKELSQLVFSGKINHSLSALCILLAAPHLT